MWIYGVMRCAVTKRNVWPGQLCSYPIDTPANLDIVLSVI